MHLSTCFLLQITLQPGGGLLFRDQHDIGSGLPASAAKLAALWPDGAPPSLKAHTQPASSLGLSRQEMGLPSDVPATAVRQGPRSKEQSAELRQAAKASKQQNAAQKAEKVAAQQQIRDSLSTARHCPHCNKAYVF